MKKSNKLLLALVPTAMALFAGAHLLLYAKYKSGSYAAKKDESNIQKTLPEPVYLAVTGFKNVNFIPADYFALQYANPALQDDEPVRRKEEISFIIGMSGNKESFPFHIYKQGDTLIISGYDTLPAPKAGGEPIIRTASEIIILFHTTHLIRVEGGEVLLAGSKDSVQAHSSKFIVQASDLTLGESTADEQGRPGKLQYFNELSVQSVKSSIDLHANARIRQVRLQLDSNSTLGLHCHPDQLSIQYDDRARMDMDGINLKKLYKDAQ